MASTTTIENLPDNVLSDVFIRLLAKEVAQMRCVCKPWKALLSDPSFIKSHLHHSLENNDDILLFFGKMISFELSPKPFTARPSCSPDLDLPDLIKQPFNPQNEYGRGTVIGSINGLICFYYISSSDDKGVHIWNPSLSALFSLPSSPLQLPSCQLQFGFGFDPKTQDYKVVRLATLGDSPNMEPQCEVYSTKKGSWESISPSHIKNFKGFDQVCVNDHLHWLGYTDLKRSVKPTRILAFDLGAEVFIQVPLPESFLECSWWSRRHVLGVLGGKLCIMSSFKSGEWELWVLEKYGVAESWVKHHAFPPFSGDIIPYGFTSKGEFVFKVDQDNDNQLMRFGLYDPIEAMTKTFKISCTYRSISRFVEYVDSLVWIQPPNHEISSSDISHLQIGE